MKNNRLSIWFWVALLAAIGIFVDLTIEFGSTVGRAYIGGFAIYLFLKCADEAHRDGPP